MRRPGGARDKRALPAAKPAGRANTWRLFLSFWRLCLENLPFGSFSHRELTAKEAKRLIDKARAAHSLRGVSRFYQSAAVAQIERTKRLLVINCHFTLASPARVRRRR